jgi:hypothetical protein
MVRWPLILCALAPLAYPEDAAKTTVETPHLKLTYSASGAAVTPGGSTTLIAELDLGPGLHVYAPGVEHGYIPIAWNVKDADPVTYPAARIMEFAALKEIVPVYEGHLRLERKMSIAPGVAAPDGKLTIEGSFRYQACNDRECFLPRTLPMKWTFQVQRP